MGGVEAMKGRPVILCLGLVTVALLVSLLFWPRLPEVVPIHWGLDGTADGFGSRHVNLWTMPGAMLFLTVLAEWLVKASPRQFSVETFSRAYWSVFVVVELLFLGLHVVILMSSLPGPHDPSRWMMSLIGLGFAALGFLMRGVKRNMFMGVRTPWTIADERVWDETHAEAATLWFWAGLAIAVLAAFGVSSLVLVAMLLVTALLPVYRSYVLAKRLGVLSGYGPGQQ